MVFQESATIALACRLLQRYWTLLTIPDPSVQRLALNLDFIAKLRNMSEDLVDNMST